MILDLLGEHGDALLADFQRTYGLDLLAVVFGESARAPREILDLMQWLPDDGAFSASLRGGRKFFGWDANRLFLAMTLENGLRHHRDFQQVNSKKKVDTVKPLDIPGRAPAKRNSFMAELTARMQAAQRAPATEG